MGSQLAGKCIYLDVERQLSAMVVGVVVFPKDLILNHCKKNLLSVNLDIVDFGKDLIVRSLIL